MKYFSRLYEELDEIVRTHEPGDTIFPPKLLDSMLVEGRRISYLHMGVGNDDGPAIILIHGFGGFWLDWPRVMVGLSKHYNVYAFDLPGWGFSEPKHDNRTLEDEVAYFSKILDLLPHREIILAGVSYGAALTWAVAASKHSKVIKACLLNPMPPFPLKYMASPLFKGIFYLNSKFFSAKLGNIFFTKIFYKRIIKETLYRERLIDSVYVDLGYLLLKQPHAFKTLYLYGKGAKKIRWREWEDKIRKIEIPVLIIQGKDDKIFKSKAVKYLMQLMPTAHLKEFDKCGHAIMFDQYRKLTETLLSFAKLHCITDKVSNF